MPRVPLQPICIKFRASRTVKVHRIVLTGLLFYGWLGGLNACAKTQNKVVVACAASAFEAVSRLAERFESQTGIPIGLVAGSSGKFYNQIAHGAPFDLFFSADQHYPELLEQSALVSMRRTYARGRIVLWAARRSGYDVARGLSMAQRGTASKIAIGNPRVAPYGKAAIEALEHAGLYSAVRHRLVMGENISQAAQFVESGAAKVGIISLSLALSSSLTEAGSYWLIPNSYHGPLDADVVLLKRTRLRAQAERFLIFATSTPSQSVWSVFGLERPTPVASRSPQ